MSNQTQIKLYHRDAEAPGVHGELGGDLEGKLLRQWIVSKTE